MGLYLTLLFIGMIYSIKLGLGGIYNWVDIMSVIILAISWYSAWMFAVHTNDITDVKTDSVSNPSRPITSKKLDVIEMREISYIWLVLSLFGSFSVGYCTFFLNLVFTAAYYIYSVPPLRLKRVPILSSFLISIACLSTVLAGFFFLSISKVAITFPVMFAVGIVTIFTLAVNIRDLKDVAGDKTEGINTLPVLFEKNGRKIVGILFSLAFLLVPIFLSFYALYLIAIPASIVGYILVMRDPYQEKYIFDLFFVFLVLLVISYFVL